MPDEVVAQLSPDHIQMEPGGRPVDVTLTIQNRSDSVAEYVVELTGLDADWFTPPPSRAPRHSACRLVRQPACHYAFGHSSGPRSVMSGGTTSVLSPARRTRQSHHRTSPGSSPTVR